MTCNAFSKKWSRDMVTVTIGIRVSVASFVSVLCLGFFRWYYFSTILKYSCRCILVHTSRRVKRMALGWASVKRREVSLFDGSLFPPSIQPTYNFCRSFRMMNYRFISNKPLSAAYVLPHVYIIMYREYLATYILWSLCHQTLPSNVATQEAP